MAPRAPSVSRQDRAYAGSRLIVRVLTQLARLPRYGRGVSFFYFPDQIQLKEFSYGYIDLVVGWL